MKYEVITKKLDEMIEKGEGLNYKISPEVKESSEYQLKGSGKLRNFVNVGNKKLLVSTVWAIGYNVYETMVFDVYSNGNPSINWDSQYGYYRENDVSDATQHHFDIINMLRILNDILRKNKIGN